MQSQIAKVLESATTGVEWPEVHSGDTVAVKYKIKEGNKERLQEFQGVVLQIRGKGDNKNITIRKMSGSVGVERIFPMNSPFIDSLRITKYGKVRRARIFYFRKLKGKKAKIKEKKYTK